MTLPDWKRREDLQLRLEATLREDHVVAALSVLTDMGLPTGTQVADLTLNALKNAYNEGYFKCLTNLERLPNLKETERAPLPKSWEKRREQEKE